MNGYSFRAAALLALVLPLITFASLGAESQPGTRRSFDTVAKLASITTRDGGGRALRFADSRNREFAVKRDAQWRVQSIEATRRPHFSDIVSIAYAPNGDVVAVRFRTGYTLFFDTQPNGAQIVRDSQGGALQREGRTTQALDGAGPDQSAALATVIDDLESLLAALGQPMN